MKFTFRKIATALLLLILAVSIYLNWSYNGKTDGDTAKILGEAAYVSNTVAVEDDAYAAERLARETAREESLALLEEVLNNPTADGATYQQAYNEKIAIARAIEQETNCEIELKSKGFTAVLVSIQGEKGTVFVGEENLTPIQVVQIQETVHELTDVLPENIKIVLSR